MRKQRNKNGVISRLSSTAQVISFSYAVTLKLPLPLKWLITLQQQKGWQTTVKCETVTGLLSSQQVILTNMQIAPSSLNYPSMIYPVIIYLPILCPSAIYQLPNFYRCICMLSSLYLLPIHLLPMKCPSTSCASSIYLLFIHL